MNPSGSDALDSVSVPHATQHADLNDAVEALEAKVGVNGSAVTTSLDYKVAQQGLVLVKTQAITSGTGTVTITGAFSSTFDNYRIQITGSLATGQQIALQIGAAATNYKWALVYSAYAGTVTQLVSAAGTSFLYAGVGDSNFISFDVSVMNPNRAQYTAVGSPWASPSEAGHFSGIHQTATAYTSFTLLPGGTTFNASTVRVYGYNNG